MYGVQAAKLSMQQHLHVVRHAQQQAAAHLKHPVPLNENGTTRQCDAVSSIVCTKT